MTSKSIIENNLELYSNLEIKIENYTLKNLFSSFFRYCSIDERLVERVSKDYKNISLRFLKFSSGIISKKSVRSYLQSYLGKSPKTYNNQLCGLRAFICRFLRHPEIMVGFKKAHVNHNYDIELPTKTQLSKGFSGLTDNRERAIFLFYATSGLRRTEGLMLNRFEDLDYELRAVKSKHCTRTKNAGVTFYNFECETYLKRYLDSREDEFDKLFYIGFREFERIWLKASKISGFKIKPQILRKWHSTELGELGIPDRYVDILQGRAPQSVIGKFYTGTELDRLKRLYEKANIKVLT